MGDLQPEHLRTVGIARGGYRAVAGLVPFAQYIADAGRQHVLDLAFGLDLVDYAGARSVGDWGFQEDWAGCESGGGGKAEAD